MTWLDWLAGLGCSKHTLSPESSLISVLFFSSFLAKSYTALCSTFVELIATSAEKRALQEGSQRPTQLTAWHAVTPGAIDQ